MLVISRTPNSEVKDCSDNKFATCCQKDAENDNSKVNALYPHGTKSIFIVLNNSSQFGHFSFVIYRIESVELKKNNTLIW